jgi:hypothetical protein
MIPPPTSHLQCEIDSATAVAAPPIPEPGRRRAGIALTAYVLLLTAWALCHSLFAALEEAHPWDLQDSHRLVALVVATTLAWFMDLARFIPVGFLTICALRQNPSRRARLVTAGTALIAGIGCAAWIQLVGSWRSGNAPSLLGLVAPVIGCLVGIGAGRYWRSGQRSHRPLAMKLAVLGLLLGGTVAGMIALAFESRPLSFEPATLVSEEKVRILDTLRQANPRRIPPGTTRSLVLTRHEIDVLLAWGLSVGSAHRKAMVTLADRSATLTASLGLPLAGDRRWYLNTRCRCRPVMDDGVLRVDLERLRVGRIEVPGMLLKLVSVLANAQLRRDPRTRPIIAAFKDVSVGNETISVICARMDLPKGYRDEVFGSLGPDENVQKAVVVQLRHLFQIADSRPPREERFAFFLTEAFAMARERSQAGDPVVENRAAILALGYLLGHPRLGEFLGPDLPTNLSSEARHAFADAPIRGRKDWTKHFFITSSLTVLSTMQLGLEAGLLKEEIDAVGGQRAGASYGLSFTDLLADRAGTVFAKTATSDADAARAIQERLARGFAVDDFFPPAADLPEEIPLNRFEQEYGGVGGEGYRKIIAEIDRRVAGCAAYQNANVK